MTLASETTRPTFPAQALSPYAAAYPGPMVAIRKLRELKWLSPSQTLVMFALIGRVHNVTGETPEVRSAIISFDIKHLMFTVTGDVPHLRRTLETYLRNEKRITKMALDRAVKCEIASIAQDRSMGRYVPWQSEEEIRASFVGFT